MANVKFVDLLIPYRVQKNAILKGIYRMLPLRAAYALFGGEKVFEEDGQMFVYGPEGRRIYL